MFEVWKVGRNCFWKIFFNDQGIKLEDQRRPYFLVFNENKDYESEYGAFPRSARLIFHVHFQKPNHDPPNQENNQWRNTYWSNSNPFLELGLGSVMEMTKKWKIGIYYCLQELL